MSEMCDSESTFWTWATVICTRASFLPWQTWLTWIIVRLFIVGVSVSIRHCQHHLLLLLSYFSGHCASWTSYIHQNAVVSVIKPVLFRKFILDVFLARSRCLVDICDISRIEFPLSLLKLTASRQAVHRLTHVNIIFCRMYFTRASLIRDRKTIMKHTPR